MFDEIREINEQPGCFGVYTADTLWTDEHTAGQMLEYHLNEGIEAASRSGEFIGRSVEWIVSHFGVDDETAIADFGCGPGLYASRLAEKGADVTGIDFSANSLEYAKGVAAEKGLSIEYACCNYLEYETDKKFDLIIMIMCDFCALSPEQRKVLLSKFRSMLKDGGQVLLDVYSLESFDKREEAASYELNQLHGFWSADDYYCFLNTFKYDDEKVVLDKYTIIEESRKRVVYNWLQYFSKDSLRKEFKDNGFTVEEIYSDVAGRELTEGATELAVVAKRA